MKKTLAWIPMLLGALVLHGFAETPVPPAGEPATTSTKNVLASGAEEPTPVLHYTFGRSRKSARIKDRSGHRNNGMAVHPLRRVPGIAKGQWAARFDGTSDYIRVPRSASLEPEELTVDAWVRIRGRNPNYKAGAIVFKRNTGTAYNEDYCLEILSDRTVLMTVSSPPSQQGQTRLNGDTVLSPDLWHHLAMTFRPGEAVLYVDGRKEVRMRIPSDSHARLEHNTDADLFIGTRDHATYPLDRFGAFDLAELRIWPKALGAKRIAALYGEYANQPGVAKPPRDRSHIDRDTLCTVDIAPESLVLHLAPIPSCKTFAKVRDRSNRNNHGVATRPLQRVCDGAWRAWRFDSARQDFIRIPRAPSLEPEAITVAVWVRIPGGIEPADAGAVIFKRNTSFHDNEGYNLEILPDRRVRMTIGHSGGQKDVISREVLAPDLWHHVAMTFLGGRMRLYVDGKPAGEARFIQALDHNPSTDLLIGGRDHASHPMDRFAWFDLADLRIWSKALNMHQIAALYGEFADRPKVAHPADNRAPAPTHQNADHTFICGTPSFPPSRPVSIDAPDIRRDALVLHYAFATPKDGTELRDRSGHQANGSASRPLEWVRENGNLEGALRFDGVGDHIRVPRSASLEPEAVTVAAWVKIDASRPMIKPGGTVVFKRNPSFYNNEDYQLEIRSNRTVMATCANPSGVQTKAISPHPIEPDVWHHLAMGIGKGWIRLYIDGAPVADTPCAYPLNHNPEADLFIGAKDHVHYPIDHPCPMELAEVRIWSAVLNESEIAALYREKALFSDVAEPGMKRGTGKAPATDRPICGLTPPVRDKIIRKTDLVLQYAFDFRTPEGCTDLQDLSGRRNNGKAIKPLEWVKGPGNLGEAVRFDGVEDCIRVPRAPSMEADVVTAAAWVKLDGSRPLSHTGTIVFKRNTSFYQNEDYHLEIRPDRVMQAFCGDGTGNQRKVVVPMALAPDVWHHLAMTAGDGRIRLFVDGEPVAAEPWPHALAHNPEADLFIGAVDHARFPIGNHCPMELADIRIWSAVLNESEIAALYREKALFSDVAKPGMNRPPEPPRVFPPWQPPEKKDGEGALAAELRALLEQGRLDKAASPEFLDALQRTLDRHFPPRHHGR